MNTNITSPDYKPEPMTARESARFHACACDPARRRHAPTLDQGVMFGQMGLLDCIAESPELAEGPNPPVARDAVADAAVLLRFWRENWGFVPDNLSRVAGGHMPSVHLSSVEFEMRWEPERVADAVRLLSEEGRIERDYWRERCKPKAKRGYKNLLCAGIWRLASEATKSKHDRANARKLRASEAPPDNLDAFNSTPVAPDPDRVIMRLEPVPQCPCELPPAPKFVIRLEWPCIRCGRETPDESLDLETSLCPSCAHELNLELARHAPGDDARCMFCERLYPVADIDPTGYCPECIQHYPRVLMR